jgi:carbon monoxide dehydrogenase subunit G
VQLSGEQTIAAPRPAVWEALNDPEMLARCIPGCETVERHSATQFEATVMTKVGPLRARFTGKVEMRDVDAPAGCTIHFEGGAGSMGMAQGQSKVTLTEMAGGTLLRYQAEAAIGGKLGQIGGRLIDASAKKLADDFFGAFKTNLNTPEPAAETSTAVPVKTTVAPAPHSAPPTGPAAGWGGEVQRLFWLLIGAVFGGIIGHLVTF